MKVRVDFVCDQVEFNKAALSLAENIAPEDKKNKALTRLLKVCHIACKSRGPHSSRAFESGGTCRILGSMHWDKLTYLRLQSL